MKSPFGKVIAWVSSAIVLIFGISELVETMTWGKILGFLGPLIHAIASLIAPLGVILAGYLIYKGVEYLLTPTLVAKSQDLPREKVSTPHCCCTCNCY